MADAETEVPDHYRFTESSFAASIDPDAGIDVSCFMSTTAVDDDDEVVLPGGADLGRFTKNGPLMLCHDWAKEVSYYPLPVGHVDWVKKRPNGLLGGLRFARGTEMGREVKALVEEKILRGVSIGFKTLEASPMTKDEASSRPDWSAAFARTKGKVKVIRRWRLLELSVVPIPCNEDALIQTLKVKGLSRPGWVKPAPERAMSETTDETATPEAEPAPEMKALPAPEPTPEPEPEPEPADEPEVKAMDDGDEPDDDEGPIRNGNFVKCVKGSYKGMVGKVKSVHRGGMVPDVEDDVMGTRTDPAAKVNVHKPMGDGHKATDHHVGVKVAHLEKTDDLKPPKRRKGIDPLTLPPISGRTDDQVAADRLREIRKALTPRALAEAVRAAEDRAMGVV